VGCRGSLRTSATFEEGGWDTAAAAWIGVAGRILREVGIQKKPTPEGCWLTLARRSYLL
tara:strand:- start:916 stop:1092 length:177 start_codon:yes stop_codon:yes gene_type:complete